MERSPEKREGHVTASVLLGGCLLECFIAADALACPPREIQGFTEEHYHASYELLLCQGGAGFQFANGTAYGYQADTVFLFPPHVRHASLLNRGQRERRTSIRFLVHPRDRARNGGAGDLERALASLREAGCAHFPMDGRMTRLLDMLREETPGRGELETGGLLAALFGRVLQVLCRSFGQGGSGAGQMLDDTGRRKFLVDHYFDRVADSGEEQGRLKELCGQLHLSPSQLNRFLKETYGVTFKQRTVDVRLAKIKYYLRYTDLTSAEIAQRMNFPSDSSFSLFFKQHEGMTPTAFRRQSRQEAVERE